MLKTICIEEHGKESPSGFSEKSPVRKVPETPASAHINANAGTPSKEDGIPATMDRETIVMKYGYLSGDVENIDKSYVLNVQASSELVEKQELPFTKTSSLWQCIEKVSKLTINKPRSVSYCYLEALSELEMHGFDVKAMVARISNLLSVKIREEEVKNKKLEEEMQNSPCSIQISLEIGVSQENENGCFTISLASPTNHSNVLQFNPCEYAFIADQRTFNVSDLQLSTQPFSRITQEFIKSDVVIEWVAREETCEEAQSNSNSFCGSNTNSSYSENGNEYRCVCKDGFTGNPYLPQGCQDIDECKEANKYPCQGSCKNIIGSYTCKCPIGMRGDGKSGCQGFRVTAIAAVVGAVLLTMIIAMLILIMYKRRRKETNFFRNGGMLLKHQRVRIFTEAELVKATKNYDESQLLGEGGFGYVYKGILADGTQIAVKKAKDISKAQINEEYQQEIGIVSQVNHKNVVKILGLCLETKVPLLVYEFISNGTLFQHIHHKKPQALANWKNRLRVAEETALALNYLHSLADPPIIHGDVKTSNILLDDTYTAKVSDFGASVLISPGDSDMASKIKGTFGYLDPEYLMTGCLTEKSDVYSFGVVLVELLTGEKPNFMARSGEKSNVIQYFISSIESHDLDQLVCFGVANEDEMEEIEAFAEIAKQCLCSSGAKRPTMKEVADEFGRLRKLNERSRWNHDKKSEEETEHLLGESSYDSIHVENLNQHDIYSLEMDLYPAYSI
ncbi:wall-associated receptor kinase 3-like [Euphorbia lathyris]|uniref:wall-associated receptor kinase 3-like n=1 Tax=Euphorbia lathyris TaxID=212925 RepID=UPI0033144771